jgi:hypothetical protein
MGHLVAQIANPFSFPAAVPPASLQAGHTKRDAVDRTQDPDGRNEKLTTDADSCYPHVGVRRFV